MDHLPQVLPYEDWIAKDHALMTLITATLSPAALAYVVRCETSKQMWDTLVTHYSSSSRTNIVSLKSDLQSITKKPSETIDQYFKRIKELKDKLAHVFVVIDNEYLVIYALNGLPTEYNTFRTSMRTCATPITFAELHVLLVSEEIAIEKQIKRDESFSLSAALFVAHNSNQNSNSNFGRRRGKNKASNCGRFMNYGNSERGCGFPLSPLPVGQSRSKSPNDGSSHCFSLPNLSMSRAQCS